MVPFACVHNIGGFAMKNWLKKICLFIMMGCNCSTLLLPWVNHHNIQELNGTVVLTGNLFLSLFIFALYFISVLFFEKNSKVFFCTGISSLSMLFAIMFSRFESWGRFSNSCLGPYLGLASVVATFVLYVLFFYKEFAKCSK